jgi:hypothetical protein
VRDYTIWSKNGEVGENVLQENFDDVIIPNVAPLPPPPKLLLTVKQVSICNLWLPMMMRLGIR